MLSSAAPAHPPLSQRLAEGLTNSFRQRRLTLDGIDTSELKEVRAKHAAEHDDKPKPSSRRMSLSPEMVTGWLSHAPPVEELFPRSVVGTFSCHGTEPGRRPGAPAGKINQDRGLVSYPFAGNPAAAMFAVFDGHGLSGAECSQFVAHTLQALLEDHPALFDEPERALQESFVRVDELLGLERGSIDAEASGTTATVILLIEDVLYTACCGDSRAVLASHGKRKGQVVAHDLSRDHKPDLPEELARIKKHGGFVSPPEDWGGPARVYLDSQHTAPGLAMSRSIGDHGVKRIGVTAEPDVSVRKLSEQDAFIVLASDGVWEFLQSDAAATLVAPLLARSGATNACTKLIERASAAWRKEEGDYRDDITAMIIKLPCMPEPK